MKYLVAAALATLSVSVYGQTGDTQTDPTSSPTAGKITPREFNIPVSPLFDLMGVAPSLVSKTSELKDFKVDWSFKNWRLNPNLAIEAQPIWEIFYNRKNLKKYQQASWAMQRLASLDLSVGTVQNENNDRRLGGALKINLYREKDPLLEANMYDDIQETYGQELALLKQNEALLLKALDTTVKPADVLTLRQQLRDNDLLLSTFYARRTQAISERASTFITDNWNSAYVDLAYGKIYTYITDSTGSLNHLRLNRNTGSGLWLNFGQGIGKRFLVSGLIRTSFYEEELFFSTQDSLGQLTEDTAVAGNKLFSFGINIRYGGPIYNFFVEFVHERKAFKTPVSALNDVFTTPDGQTLVESSVKWDIVKPYTLSFGGNWRISRNVIIDFGIRCLMDKNFKASTFLPVASISCMMR